MPKSKRNRRSKNKTGYMGVIKNTKGSKYQARIRFDGKLKHLGTHDTAEQAATAYDKEAIKLLRPLSFLNYPKQAPVGYTPTHQALHFNNTVGYRGVAKNYGNYKCQITISGKRIQLYGFKTAKEAAIAYDRAVLKSNQSTTLLNFPDMVHNLDVEPKRQKIKRSSTGYRGVGKSLKKFKAYIVLETGEHPTYLGTFDTAKEAALAYDQAAIKKGNKKSTLNFPKEEKKQEKQKKQKMKKMKKRQKKQKITKKKELLTMQEYKEMLQASK
jgi:hypothetical protein